jgi:hypothetical protein
LGRQGLDLLRVVLVGSTQQQRLLLNRQPRPDGLLNLQCEKQCAKPVVSFLKLSHQAWRPSAPPALYREARREPKRAWWHLDNHEEQQAHTLTVD